MSILVPRSFAKLLLNIIKINTKCHFTLTLVEFTETDALIKSDLNEINHKICLN